MVSLLKIIRFRGDISIPKGKVLCYDIRGFSSICQATGTPVDIPSTSFKVSSSTDSGGAVIVNAADIQTIYTDLAILQITDNSNYHLQASSLPPHMNLQFQQA